MTKKLRGRGEGNASTARIMIWYIIGNVFAKGMAVVSTPIFTRLMSKSEYGQFSIFISWENIMLILATLDLSTSIARAKYDFDERMNEYISSILLFSNTATLCAYALVEWKQDFFVKLFSMDIRYIRMLFVYLLFSPAFTYLQYKHRIYKRYKSFVACSVSTAVIQTVASVVLVLIMEDKFLGRVCGYLIPATLFNLVIWIAVIMAGKRMSWDCIRYACRISIPLIPHSLAGIVLGSSDRIMIAHYCGSEENATYSLAYTISMLANLLWTAMNRAWVPWMYDNMDQGNMKVIKKKSKLYLGFFSLIVVAVMLVAPEIIWIMGGNKYYGAIHVMPPVILGCVFQFIYGMYVNIEIFSKHTFVISVGSVVAAALNVFLNQMFIPEYGYGAAAYTTLVGYFALFLFHYSIVQGTIKQYAGIYDKKFIFSVSILLVCVGGISLVLYQHNLVRYILFALYLTLLSVWGYKHRVELKHLLGLKGT